MKCKFCKKECKNANSHRNHERLCPQNPDRNYVSRTIGLASWNKGLTKETDERVAVNSKNIRSSLRKLFDSGFKSTAHTQEYWTEERRQAKSQWKKNLHETNPELHPNRLLAGNRKKMTYPEQVAFDWLSKNVKEFEHQKKIGPFYVDFCVGSVIIEIDGERWHPEGNEKDAARDKVLVEQGFIVYRIRSKEKIEEKLETIYREIVQK